MAGYRKPGSQGADGRHEDVMDGTSGRHTTPSPSSLGSVGHETRLVHARKPKKSAVYRRKNKETPELPLLRQGMRHEDVKKLQRLLNLRILPSPELKLDGEFGPLTLRAVQQFQKGARLSVDGVVGKVTWYHLLVGDIVRAQQPLTPPAPGAPAASARANPAPVMGPAKYQPTAPKEKMVWEWTLKEKLLEVLRRVPKRLPGEAMREFKALIQPESLAVALLIIAGFSLLSGGTALVVGVILLGADVTLSLAKALQATATAYDEADLDEAADDLSHVVITLGVAAFLKGVQRVARRLQTTTQGGEPTPSEPVESSQPKPTTKAGPKGSKPTDSAAPKMKPESVPDEPKPPPATPPSGPKMSPYGDVTEEELANLKEIAKKTGEPVDVVGSAAKGTRRGVGQDLPLGKDPGMKSDLDLRVDSEADIRQRGGMSDAIYDKFPKGKDVDHILTGDPYPGEPRITVNPDGSVVPHGNVPIRNP